MKRVPFITWVGVWPISFCFFIIGFCGLEFLNDSFFTSLFYGTLIVIWVVGGFGTFDSQRTAITTFTVLWPAIFFFIWRPVLGLTLPVTKSGIEPFYGVSAFAVFIAPWPVLIGLSAESKK